MANNTTKPTHVWTNDKTGTRKRRKLYKCQARATLKCDKLSDKKYMRATYANLNAEVDKLIKSKRRIQVGKTAIGEPVELIDDLLVIYANAIAINPV